MPKLAFSTNAYLKYPFDESSRPVGPRSVTPASRSWPTCRTAWPAYLLPEQKQAIRDALARHRLEISNVNAS